MLDARLYSSISDHCVRTAYTTPEGLFTSALPQSTDTVKVQLPNELGSGDLMFIDSDSALHLAEQSFTLATEARYLKGCSERPTFRA